MWIFAFGNGKKMARKVSLSEIFTNFVTIYYLRGGVQDCSLVANEGNSANGYTVKIIGFYGGENGGTAE